MYHLRSEYSPCRTCEKAPSKITCGECQLMTYCTEKCRTQDLKAHSPVCNTFKEDREQAEAIVQTISKTLCPHLLSLLNSFALKNRWSSSNAFGIMICDSDYAEALTKDPLAFCVRIFSLQMDAGPRDKDLKLVFPAAENCTIRFTVPHDPLLDTIEQVKAFEATAALLGIGEAFFCDKQQEIVYYVQEQQLIMISAYNSNLKTRTAKLYLE